MAIAIPSPAPAANDLVTLDEAVVFIAQSGHGASKSTITRWIARYRLPVVRCGRRIEVSMSDLLRAQRDELDRLAD